MYLSCVHSRFEDLSFTTKKLHFLLLQVHSIINVYRAPRGYSIFGSSTAMEQIMKNTAIVGAERKGFPDSPSSSSISSFGNLSESSFDSGSDSFDEVTSPSSSSADHPPANNDPVLDMSSLIQHLPIKRGLSKHYEGKSQSFTSLANVRSLEDLAKPESSYNKKLKIKSYRRSYGGGMMGETIDRGILKSSRVSCSSMNEKRASSNMEITSRPPTPPPHRSTSAATTISNQTPLFA